MATFYPANEATNISPIKPIITITFESAIYSAFETEGTAFIEATLKEAFAFKLTDTNGADVDCTMGIDGTNKIVTITPKSELIDTQKYYVAIIANKVFTAADTTETAANASWTVGIVKGTSASMNNITETTLGSLNVDETTLQVECADDNIVLVVYNSSADTDYEVTILAPVEGHYAAVSDDKTVKVTHGKTALIPFESAKYTDKKGRLRIKGKNAAVKYAFFKKS